MADDRSKLRRRHSFDEDPDNYQAGRPDYPSRVYEVLVDRCGLRPGTRVLEIGPGTGQVTGRLAAVGASVVAIELGPRLATRLREQVAGQDVTVVEGDFATVELPGRQFDLAVCGTAFHWLDPETAVRRLARLVRPGGWLAVWWTVFRDPQRWAVWRRPLDALYERYLPGEQRDPKHVPVPLQVGARTAEFEAGGWFGPVQAEIIRWEHQLSAEAARRLWATFSNVRELPAGRREEFLNGVAEVVRRQPGEAVVDNYVTGLYTAHRRSPAAR